MAVVVQFDLLSNDVIAQANQTVVKNGATLTTNGQSIVVASLLSKQVNLLANVKSISGGGTITFSIEEIDPVDASNSIVTSLDMPTASTGTFSAAGTDTCQLPNTIGSAFLVSWVVTGTISAVVNLTLLGKN